MAPALTLENTQLDATSKVSLKATGAAQPEVNENYDGNYQFAPIEESQVARAMIKRYVRRHLWYRTILTVVPDTSTPCTRGLSLTLSSLELEAQACLAPTTSQPADPM
jgi:hypothetical protein